MLALLQIVVLLAIASLLCRYKAALSKRNAQSWESLLARLQPAWSARELSDLCLWEERKHDSPTEKWQRIRAARGLWAMYRNAGVMLEMADYAARNSGTIDREILAELRRDSMTIRVYVLRTVADYVFSAASDSICMNTLRVEAAFAEMELRMAGLLEAATPDLVPGFVAAM